MPETNQPLSSERPRQDAHMPVVTFADRLASGGAMTIREFAAWSSVSRSTVYVEIAAGRLRVTKVGSRTLIPAASARAWAEAALKAE